MLFCAGPWLWVIRRMRCSSPCSVNADGTQESRVAAAVAHQSRERTEYQGPPCTLASSSFPLACRAAFQAHHPSFHLAAPPQTLPFMPPTASPYKLSTLYMADPNTPSTSPSPSQHGPGESTQPTSWVSPTLPFLWVCGNLTPLLSTSFSSSRR